MKLQLLKDKRKRKVLAAYLLSLLVLGGLLGTVSYSWIRRNWSPSVYEKGIKIEANGSLAFKLEGQNTGTATDAVSISSVLNMDNFVLKPVSNLSGKSEDFFSLDKTEPGREFFTHLSPAGGVAAATSSDWTEQGKTYGYVEFKFMILAEDVKDSSGNTVNYTKYIYLQGQNLNETTGLMEDVSNTSYLKTVENSDHYDAAQAVRISLTVDRGGETNTTLILENEREDHSLFHSAVNPVNDGAEWYANGALYWSDYEEHRRANTFTYGSTSYSLVQSVSNAAGAEKSLYTLADFDGGITRDADTGIRSVDPEKCLFSMSSGASKWVTLRIWLEGEDPMCMDEIAGRQLDMLLSFASVNCYSNTNTIIEQGGSN